MIKVSSLTLAPLILALAACGESPSGNSETAQDYAARINGAGGEAAAPSAGSVDGAAPATPEQAAQVDEAGQIVQPVVLPAPTIAQPLPGAASGAYVPGTLTDPNSATCGANLMGQYVGKEADLATKAAIKLAASGANASGANASGASASGSGEVRFVSAGESVNPDPTSPRLNIMIDNLNIIRDARCG